MKKIVLTGGGTAGHVTPNIALISQLEAENWQIEYIGSDRGIERQLIQALDLPFHGIASGKLRRYFDWQNFIDPFKVLWGTLQAFFLLRQIKPRLVFSKGGFVTVPVILACWLNRIPVIIHESDITPGLANKIALPFASQICVTFPETQQHLPAAIVTGLPIRPEILQGDRQQGRKICEFTQDLPVLLAIGGSSGSARINQAVRDRLPELTNQFQIVHSCGKGNLDPGLANMPNYRQFEYLGTELADILAMADLVISRAGANSIFELLALRKPHLLIPLPRASSRGDQILNAKSFQKQGYSAVLFEQDLNQTSLQMAIEQLWQQRQEYIDRMSNSTVTNSIDAIVKIIDQLASE
ncbi:UDP-N-acetylglucosamine--N-acetylmuramyl-(pentapeptide) pyrophosphoryl-undecaprenol N-acetylglucosamine transferase [Thalassoporum mexicanum PCC 7367]|uniref:undecaprenyldiphospho-muramoylpentapeptide beta-N-acetylglucosaminyltransferase n=1 Tax=Thalassoporum mexicanum TaxID=3457544 RepID=UPI00029FF585|nr:undecaprenyldiphospho-muramoylpentapeptide beta-N-acetylglucosaminyltransferase [Pseudanabaena sp. PCC 7367]AFY69892.1 UDP-N-acetylglucosamine--N-acetylmuramyl-(pentapeptide) pyrophosphoryl-undecaprenol N-acetylglucosamine transferase [Pseudanabaena sp. PCC 7367]